MRSTPDPTSIKTRILDAGVALLETQGIATVTQPRVAKLAGVSQGHLTYYFPTRNRLLLGIAEAAIERVLEGMRESASVSATADLGRQLGELVVRHAPVRVLLGLIVAADSEPELRSALDTLIGRVREGLAGLLAARGVAVSPEQVLALHAGIVGLAIMNLARQTEASEAEVCDGAAELLSCLAGRHWRVP